MIGEPQNADLKEAAAAGRLRVSISSVAIEANRSRTLIGHDKCPFPDVRQRILKFVAEGPSARQVRRALRSTNQQNAELRRQLAESASIQAALILELNKLKELTHTDIRQRSRSKGAT